VQKVGDNGYKIELPSDINISATFNVGDLTHYIEDEDQNHEDLKANPLQEGKVDTGQVTQRNLVNHIKALVRNRPMVTIAQGFQGISLLKSLLTLSP